MTRYFCATCLTLMTTSSSVIAVSLGPNCEPAGPINAVKAFASPSTFWPAAMKFIDDEVQGAYVASRMTRIDLAHGRVEKAQIEREMQASGIQPIPDPKLDQAINEANKGIIQMDADLLQHTLLWANRCRAHVRSKLQR